MFGIKVALIYVSSVSFFSSLFAHKFYPRYVTDVGSDFSDIALIVKKMLKNTYFEKIFVIGKSEIKNSSFRKPSLQQANEKGGDIKNA
jgi:ABC-type branched-subunit amino acid transport system substrate-binding protein